MIFFLVLIGRAEKEQCDSVGLGLGKSGLSYVGVRE